MKFILLVFLSITSSYASATNKIIDYRFGNQITGSTLTVFDDGSIHHSERICCPPRAEPVEEANLSQEGLNQLLKWIDIASRASQASLEGGQSAEGSSSGELIAFDKNGKAVNIRTIEFGHGHGDLQAIHYNTAPESREIEKFVYEKVNRKMSEQ